MNAPTDHRDVLVRVEIRRGILTEGGWNELCAPDSVWYWGEFIDRDAMCDDFIDALCDRLTATLRKIP